MYMPNGTPTAYAKLVRAPGEFFLGGGPPPRKDQQGESKETTESSPYKRRLQAASAVNKTNHYLRTSDTTEKDEKRLQNTGTPVLLPDLRTPVICTGFLPFHLSTPLSMALLWRAYRIDISQTWIHDPPHPPQKKTLSA